MPSRSSVRHGVHTSSVHARVMSDRTSCPVRMTAQAVSSSGTCAHLRRRQNESAAWPLRCARMKVPCGRGMRSRITQLSPSLEPLCAGASAPRGMLLLALERRWPHWRIRVVGGLLIGKGWVSGGGLKLWVRVSRLGRQWLRRRSLQRML